MVAVEEQAEMMTVAELATELRISLPRAYALISEIGIPHVRLSERRIRIPRAAYEEWKGDRIIRQRRTAWLAAQEQAQANRPG